MSKCRSLENQMLHALASAKSQGESKRSYRSETGSTGAKIFGAWHRARRQCNYLRSQSVVRAKCSTKKSYIIYTSEIKKNHAKNVTKIKIKICANFSVIFSSFIRIYRWVLLFFAQILPV